MRNITLVQVIKVLKNSNKSSFELRLKGKENNYKLTIAENIKCEVLGKQNEPISQYTRTEPSDIDIDDVTVTYMKEIKYNCIDIIEEHILYLKRETELYIKLFRILRENVMFLIESEGVIHQLHYINGRVYVIIETEDTYEVHETDMLNLHTMFPDFSVVLLSSLPKRYHYSNFFSEQNSIAVNRGKVFRNYKRGVAVR